MSILDFAKVIEQVRHLRTDVDKITQQPQQPAFDPIHIVSNEDKVLVDLFEIPIKYKGKKAIYIDETVDKAAKKDTKREEWKYRMKAISPKELEEFKMQWTTKKSKKIVERQHKRHQDEVAGVSTSSAPIKGQISDPVRVVIPPITEDEIMSNPTTMRVNIAPGKVAGASPYLIYASDK